MDVTLVIQLGLAILLALGVGVWANTRHADYVPPEGVVEMILLTTFLEDNFPSLCEGECFHSASPVEPPKELRAHRARNFTSVLQRFRASGPIEEDQLLPDSEQANRLGPVGQVLLFIVMAVALLVSSPVIGFFVFWRDVGEKEEGRSCSPIVHPRERAHLAMQIVGALLSVIVVALSVYYFVAGPWRLVVVAALAAPALFLTVCLGKLTLNQRRWKEFWLEKLRLSLQMSAHRNNHDQYNRALNLYHIVDRHSLLPFTDLQKLLLACFAAVQLIVPPFAQWFERVLSTLPGS